MQRLSKNNTPSFLSIACVSLFLFIITSFNLNAQNPIGQKQALRDILDWVERNNQLVFSYNDEMVDSIYLRQPPRSENVKEYIDDIFSRVQLSYKYIDSTHVIILPEIKSPPIGYFYFCGYVEDEGSGLPLSFAYVYNDSKSIAVETKEDGFFSIVLPHADTSLNISYLGYDIRTIRAYNNSSCEIIRLRPSVNILDAVVLREYLSDGIQIPDDLKSVRFDYGTPQNLPGVIDNDIFSSVLMLPGVNTPNETLDQIHIRGGTPDQNLVLWDDIPVYHTSHLFGMISAFNPFAIDEVNVYRSSIASEYGGRVSGIIDIQSKSSIPEKFSGSVGLNMTHSHLDLEIPLWKNSGLYFSFRSSLTEFWDSPTFLNYADHVFQGSKVDVERFNNSNLVYNDIFQFSDGHIKWLYNTGKSNLSISMFGNLNNLDYSTEVPEWNAFALDELDLENGGFNFSWKYKWNPKLDAEFQVTTAEYDYNYRLSLQLINFDVSPPLELISSNKIQDGGIKLGFNWQANNRQNVKFGYQFTDNDVSIEIGRKEPDVDTLDRQVFENQLHILYGEYSLKIPEQLDLDVGLRFESSPLLESRFFEPRISLSTPLNENFKLKVSTSKQFQFISQLVIFDINDLGLQNNIWIASNNTTIPVIESNQWMGGILYEKGDWTIDVEAYVKELVGITSLSSSFAILPNQPFSQGKSKVRGVDVLVKRRMRNFRSWLSYTLSETLFEFPAISSTPFSASHDIRHSVQWINMYKYGNFDFSLGFTLRSGLPFTNVDGVRLEENNNGQQVPRLNYQEVNGARLPGYFRIDVSVHYKWLINDRMHALFSASIQNMSRYENIIGKSFIYGGRDANGIPTVLENNELGLRWTPNISANLFF